MLLVVSCSCERKISHVAWIPLRQIALRRFLRHGKGCQTDLLVAMYFMARWDYRKPRYVAPCAISDIVKGTGVFPASAKKSADRLVARGFLLATVKPGNASAKVYRLNLAFVMTTKGGHDE